MVTIKCTNGQKRHETIPKINANYFQRKDYNHAYRKGFDFRGWIFRKFKGKLIDEPSRSSIKSLIRKYSTIILNEGKVSSQQI